MTVTLEEIDRHLAHAHLPALLASLVHLTGDPSLLTPEGRAAYPAHVYKPEETRTGGYSSEVQADLLGRARKAIAAHLAGAPLPPPPAPEVVRRMMDFVAGADIPVHYAPFLMDELGLGGVDTKTPDWSDPALKAAAGEMHVIVVGAGMSGLLAGLRLKQAGVPFTIVEKNPDVGGTWFENVYPGCRVDNPNHLYSYSFESGHDFPQLYSSQPVLLEYFRAVAERHNLRKNILFETTVEEAVFDEKERAWSVQIFHGATCSILRGTALITAVGQLNRPKLPDIEGTGAFDGPAFHSSRWRHDVDLTGKRVAVIGTGASAYQFAPLIATQAAHLDIFQRTPPWSFTRPNYHHDVPEGMRWLMQTVPFYDRWYRFYLFWTLTDGIYDAVRGDEGWAGPPGAIGAANAELRDVLTAAIAAQAPGRPDLVDKLIPSYPPGGKRPLVDNGGWVDMLQRDTVDLVTQPIEKITRTGVRTKDGRDHPADVLIYGTGFEASRFLWPMRIVGRGGVDLNEAWGGDARAYLGVTTPGFPNLFMIYGPNTNIVINGSIIFFSECAVRYILGCLKLMVQTGSATLEVKRDVHDAFNVKVDAENARMAWGAPQVSSWYKNATGRVSQNWPFPLVDYWTATVTPDPLDFYVGC